MQKKLENMVDRVSGLLPIVNLNIVEQHNKKNPISDICISRPIFLARAKTIATQYCSEVTFLLSALRLLDLYYEKRIFKIHMIYQNKKIAALGVNDNK